MTTEISEAMREYLRRDAEARAMGLKGHLIWGGDETDEEKAAREAAEQAEADRIAAEEAAEEERRKAEEALPEGVRNTLKAQREAEKAAKAEAARAKREAEEKAKEADDLRAKLKEREDAEKSELERAQEQAAEAVRKAEEAEARVRAAALRASVVAEASKLNLHDAAVAQRLLDPESIEYDADGEPTNIGELLKALVKDHPYLVKGKATADVGETPGGNKKSLGDEEIRKQAGRRLAVSRL